VVDIEQARVIPLLLNGQQSSIIAVPEGLLPVGLSNVRFVSIRATKRGNVGERLEDNVCQVSATSRKLSWCRRCRHCIDSNKHRCFVAKSRINRVDDLSWISGRLVVETNAERVVDSVFQSSKRLLAGRSVLPVSCRQDSVAPDRCVAADTVVNGSERGLERRVEGIKVLSRHLVRNLKLVELREEGLDKSFVFGNRLLRSEEREHLE
jgi:hypothetical protein